MENNTLCHRQYIDAALLKPSKYVSTDIDNEFYEMLRENIRHNKVLKPVIATRGLVIRDGYARTKVCMELAIPVPIEYCEDASDADEEYLRLSHNLTKPMKHFERYRAYQAIRTRFKITKCTRTDLMDNVAEYKTMIDTLGGNGKYFSRLNYIEKTAPLVFGNDEKKIAAYKKKIDDGELKISGAEKYLKEKVKQIENKKAIPEKVEVITDWVKLFQKDSRLMTIAETGLVDAIVTSPHYGFGRIDYDNAAERVGQERDVDSFTEAMKPFFKASWNVLKPDGSLWVVIGDCVREGEYQNAPENFLLMMLAMGWIINDKIIWQKTDPQPTSPFNRTICSYEYIYHFTKNKEFVYNRDWLDEIPDETITTYNHAESAYQLKSLASKVKNSLITTHKSSTAGIRKKCEERGFYCTHNATYPIDIPLYCILASTRPGDTVLDICTGTSVTGEAAVQIGRKYIGYDTNNQYIEVSKVRLEKYLNN